MALNVGTITVTFERTVAEDWVDIIEHATVDWYRHYACGRLAADGKGRLE